ncbi:MAG: TIGR02646 family protein, partial [Planctomycetales bacterium]|nr:TIGR02646 family protein [Planctomycetales bacterium]
MREISGGSEPPALTQWKLGTPGVGYGDLPSELRDLLKRSLIDEQRELCAYTGIRIGIESSHIEHLTPQSHCVSGQDVSYRNLVACYPAPGVSAEFGAVRKANWPSPAQQHLFVSPRSSECEARFSFDTTGRIQAANEADVAARETILKLGLDSQPLVRRRKQAIDATLQVRGQGPASLDAKSARKRLSKLEAAESIPGRLEP